MHFKEHTDCEGGMMLMSQEEWLSTFYDFRPQGPPGRTGWYLKKEFTDWVRAHRRGMPYWHMCFKRFYHMSDGPEGEQFVPFTSKQTAMTFKLTWTGRCE